VAITNILTNKMLMFFNIAKRLTDFLTNNKGIKKTVSLDFQNIQYIDTIWLRKDFEKEQYTFFF